MKNNIYYKGFPNNLRIARRKVETDETQDKICALLNKVKTNKKQQSFIYKKIAIVIAIKIRKIIKMVLQFQL